MEYQQNQEATLWIGNLEGFEDEKYFQTIFRPHFNLRSIKIIKSNHKADYVFLELDSKEMAQELMDQFNNRAKPLSKQ